MVSSHDVARLSCQIYLTLSTLYSTLCMDNTPRSMPFQTEGDPDVVPRMTSHRLVDHHPAARALLCRARASQVSCRKPLFGAGLPFLGAGRRDSRSCVDCGHHHHEHSLQSHLHDGDTRTRTFVR